jgi:hypothetical protein
MPKALHSRSRTIESRRLGGGPAPLLYWYSKMRRLVCYIEMLLGRLVPYKDTRQFISSPLTQHCDDKAKTDRQTALPTTLFCVIFLAGSRATSGCRGRLTRFRTPDSGGQQRAGRLGRRVTSKPSPLTAYKTDRCIACHGGYRGMNRRGRTVRSSFRFRNGTSSQKKEGWQQNTR